MSTTALSKFRLSTPKTVEDPAGFFWVQDKDSDYGIAYSGHERMIVEIARSVLKSQKEPVLYDVGAHVGLFSVRLAADTASVVAVEPNPETCKVLEQNIQNNFLSNVFVVPEAAWSVHARLFLQNEQKQHAGLTKAIQEQTEANTQIETTTLDYLIKHGYPYPTFVKIDVEGAEAEVLRGATHILEYVRPTFLVEMHDNVYDLPNLKLEVLNIFKQFSYSVNTDLTCGPSYYAYATPKEVQTTD